MAKKKLRTRKDGSRAQTLIPTAGKRSATADVPLPKVRPEKRGQSSRGGGPLAPREKRFCEFYVAGMGDREAALRAGYTGIRTAQGVTGWELRQRPEIQAEITRLMDVQGATAKAADGLLGRMIANPSHPTEIVYDKDGLVKETKRDHVALAKLILQRHGKLTHNHKVEGLEEIAAALRSKDLIVVGGDGGHGEEG